METKNNQTLTPIELIQKLGGGTTAQDFSVAIEDAVKAVRAHGGAATVSLTIKINGEKHEGQVSITDEVKKTLPKVNRPMMLAYTTPDGHLTESDPMQGVLKFTPGQASSI